MDKCPYCQKELLKTPLRKSKCPHCGQSIFVKTPPDSKQKLLVTQSGAEEIEELWRKKWERASFLRMCQEYDLTESQFNELKSKLSAKFHSAVSEKDVIWQLLNDRVEEYYKSKPINYFKIKMTYLKMAEIRLKNNQNPYKLLVEIDRMDLFEYESMKFVSKVKISTCKEDACKECKKLEGKIYTLDEALKLNPIPYKNCSNKVCRCMYLAVIGK